MTKIARRDAWIGAAGLAVAGLVALGPLEPREGLSLAGLHVSVTELLMLFALFVGGLGAWQAGVLAALRHRSKLAWAGAAVLLAWAAVHLLSALWTDGPRGEVLKWGLRVTSHVALALLAWTLAGEAAFRRRLAGGMLLSLLLISGLGVLERRLGRDLELFLRFFRDEPTWMLGEQRLATVFYHANTCAAFFEITAPFLIVLAAKSELSRPKRALLIGWLAVVAVLLSLTYSRAGLLSGVVGALVLVAAARQPRMRNTRRWLGILAGLYAVAVVAAYVANPDMRARIGLTERSYRVAYQFRGLCIGKPGETVRLPIEVRNKGEWALSNRQAPGLLIHTFLTRKGKRLLPGWEETPLPVMERDARVTIDLPVRLPGKPGPYVLVADVLRDEVLRVSALGNPLAIKHCLVLDPTADLSAALAGPEPDHGFVDTAAVRTSRPMDLERRHYWRAAALLIERKPWLGWGADRFRTVDREYLPPGTWDERARAHSVVLETAVNLGLLGVLVLLGLVVLLTRAAWVAIRHGWRSDRGPVLAAAAGLGGLAIHSQVDFFLGYTQIAVLVWPLVGLLLAGPDPPPDATPERADDHQHPSHRPAQADPQR